MSEEDNSVSEQGGDIIVEDVVDEHNPQLSQREKDEITIKNRGMPKSRRSWKEVSSRASSRNKSWQPSTWDEKKERRERRKGLRTLLKTIEDEKMEKIAKERTRVKDKMKRDELNKYKTASLDLISNTKKIKKWSRKMRQSLVKLPSEVFEQLLKNKGKRS